jgi:hypothetical protein
MDEQGTVEIQEATATVAAVEAHSTGRDNVHPMFRALFMETDADDLVADEGRRRARRSRRVRSAMVRPAAGNRPHRPRP